MTREEEERIYRGVEGYAAPDSLGALRRKRAGIIAGSSGGDLREVDRQIAALEGGAVSGPRLPPHNHQAEIQLLGAILSNNRAFYSVAAFLKGLHFADDRHGKIFDACAKLIDRGQTASATTLRGYFEQDATLTDVGGADYLGRLASSAVTIINAGDHGRIILDTWQRRELIAQLQEAAERLHQQDIEGTAADIAVDLVRDVELTTVDTTTAFRTAKEVREQIVESMKKPLVCHSTGIAPVDAVFGGGLYPGKAYGLFGRFKSGKTLLGGMISQNLGRAGVRHAYCAAEMGSAQIETRAMAVEVGVNSMSFLREKDRSNPAFVSRCGAAAISGSENVLYCDVPGLSFERLRRVVTAAVLTHRASGVVVDYLQLVGGVPKGSTRVDHLERVCQWLADFAIKRNVWVLVLGQLNSEGGARHGEAPMLAFDLCAEIHRDEGNGAWLETRVSRFTPPQTIGSALNPALYLDAEVGPRFTEGMGVAA